MRSKVKITVSFTIVSVLLLWLTLSGFDQNMQYYVSIDEVKTMTSATSGMRVQGYLVPGSLVRTDESLKVRFVIQDKGQELEVEYDKELPDTFKDGSEVLVEGKMHVDGHFQASMLMAKCPSKYDTQDGATVEGYDAELHRDLDQT